MEMTTELFFDSTQTSILSSSHVSILNSTLGSTPATAHPKHLDVFWKIIKTCYVLGIIGNLAAIITLRRGARRLRNRKHLFMLTTLAGNDLVALIGMLAMMLISEFTPEVENNRIYCAARVVLRIFGIGSVCIAVTMALERWMALTQPFLYQRYITYNVIKNCLVLLWLWTAVMTCFPLVGIGRYYDDVKGRCERYRNPHSTLDAAYAIFYVIFGTLLCAVLVYCNLAVIKALYNISAPHSDSRLTVRRISKNSSKNRLNNSNTDKCETPNYNTATAEEVAFSRLMATLSVLFMICWLPQMVTTTLFLCYKGEQKKGLIFLAILSDLLMLLNYVLDPYLYVLLRQNRYSLIKCVMDICKKGRFWHSQKTSTESIKTSCCPQESLMTDQTGFELKIVPNKPHMTSASSSSTAEQFPLNQRPVANPD